MVGDILACGNMDSVNYDIFAVKEKIMKEMFGIIFVTISLARVGYLVRNGFELRYRKWVKGVIMGFWGFVFAAGACLLMGL